MKKTIYLIFLFFLIGVISIEGTVYSYCFQDQANSLDCGNTIKGNYSFINDSNGFWDNKYNYNDSNWNTYGYSSYSGVSDQYYQVIYKKPILAGSAKWQVKWKSNVTPILENITITDSCFSESQINITVNYHHIVGRDFIDVYCNGALINSHEINAGFFYEEGMWWSINATIFECVSGYEPKYIFTLKHETNNSILNGSIFVDLIVGNNILSYEKSEIKNLSICINGLENETINGLIRHRVGLTNDYYIINNKISDTTQNITLFNFDSDIGLNILTATIRDDSWSIYPNVIGILERYYPENHTWVAVQQGKTGEFGTMFFHIIEETTEYRFKFYSTAGTLLKSTDTMKFLCDASTGRCSLTFQISSVPTALTPINSVYFYDNVTKVVNVSWNDATGITQAVRVRLTKETMTGQLVICDSTVNSANGTIRCNTTGYFGTGILTIKATQSPEEIEKKVTIELTGFPKLYDNMSKEDSGIFSFMIAGTLAFVGLTGSPVAVIVCFLFGLFLILLFNMAKIMTITLMGSFLVIGIMIALKVKK